MTMGTIRTILNLSRADIPSTDLHSNSSNREEALLSDISKTSISRSSSAVREERGEIRSMHGQLDMLMHHIHVCSPSILFSCNILFSPHFSSLVRKREGLWRPYPTVFVIAEQ